MNPLIQFKSTTLSFLIVSALMCFALSPVAHAVTPAPDGGYPGGNTAEGDFALQKLTTGTFNTALGAGTLFSNTTGFNNTADGAGALLNNIDGKANTAIGFTALFSNTTISGNTGSQNTAIGNTALANNTIGTSNTAVGSQALLNNVQGNRNTAVGKDALLSNSNTSADNTAVGFQALFSNTLGEDNVAIGNFALTANTGNHNTAVGIHAGDTITGGDHNVCIGDFAGTGIVASDHQIAIGVAATGPFADSGNTCFIGSIDGQSTSDAGSSVAVFIDDNNVLGTVKSSRRYKHDIKPMDKASKVILALKPVTFKYNHDVKGTPCYGLIAEDVAKVDPALVVRDKNGEPGTVRYEQINAMLLNEFLKEHKKVQEQGATIARLQTQVEALSAGLQKVSAQLQLTRPAPQTVVNNQ
jgi:trimeric autotransporter adhesin